MSLYANHRTIVKGLSKHFPSSVIARFNFAEGVNIATGSKAPTYTEVTLSPVVVHKGVFSRLLKEALHDRQISDMAEYTVIVDRTLVPQALADVEKRNLRIIYRGTEYAVSEIRPIDEKYIIEYDLVRGGK